ncbi:MAG TPA: hypothetical protein VE442_02330 [Jatrophihabitans sp.]|nr:hypothetical protein [Jatrophihabitans sp.]
MFLMLLLTAAISAVRGMWSPCGLSMLSSLNPVSERARGHRFWVTAYWYVAGALAGGALLGVGCALGAAGFGRLGADSTAVWTVALAGAAVAALSDARVGGWSLPMHPRQVDERWVVSYRRWIYAGGYGVQIGTGFATYVMTAGVYLTALLAILTGSIAQALGAGLVFGLVRGASIGVAARARDPERLRVLLGRVDAWTRGSALVAGGWCVAVAATAAWAVAGAPLAIAVAAVLVLLIAWSLTTRVVTYS